MPPCPLAPSLALTFVLVDDAGLEPREDIEGMPKELDPSVCHVVGRFLGLFVRHL